MPDTLNAGDTLAVNEQLQSNNGSYSLMMQGDGNLVLYEGVPTITTAVWSTGTFGLAPLFQPVRADMQDDGNFVLYSTVNNPAWASGTDGNPLSRLVLQDDRNLVIYNPGNAPLWASQTQIPLPGGPPEPLRGFAPPSANPEDFQELGAFKWMRSEATLYRDGRLVVSSKTHNYNWGAGLRGRVIVVFVDSAGRSIWVSPDYACTTRCSIPDFSCASFGTDLFTEAFPEAVGKYSVRLDVYQGEVASFADLREQVLKVIRALKDIGEGAKDLLEAWAWLLAL